MRELKARRSRARSGAAGSSVPVDHDFVDRLNLIVFR
jgi:hypothetical protein